MHTRSLRRHAATAITIGITSACASIPAGTVAPTGPTTLLATLGTDTLSVEQYTRTTSGIVGTLVSRSPVTVISRYSIALGNDGSPTSAEYSTTRADGSAIRGAAPLSFRFGADSVTIVAHRANGDTTRRIGARPLLLPWIGNAWAPFELAFVRMRTLQRDSATFALLPMSFGASQYETSPIRFTRGDSATIGWFGSPLLVHHDGQTSLLGMDGSLTTDKIRVTRVAALNLEALAFAWTARDAAGGAIGQTSTRDTARATVGGAHVWVDYGRPSLRGRDVWVNGVLGDTLWRTGANAATQLSTDRDLLIGGQSVPAGRYSLFTWAGRSGYHLIVNRETGQWGTDYHAERDLVRVPLRETNGGAPVERFTISIEPQDAMTSALVLAWGTKRLSVPVSTTR